MATDPIRPAPSDAAILAERRRSNEAVIRLLQSWSTEGDLEEQRETLAYLKQALDEDRPSSRKLFPRGSDTESHPLTNQARRARSEALGRALDGIAAMTDETDTDEVWRGVMRGIDETRPHRPLFEGSY